MDESKSQEAIGHMIINLLGIPINERSRKDNDLLQNMLLNIECLEEKNVNLREIVLIYLQLRLVKTLEGLLVFDYKDIGDGFYIILQGKVSVQVPFTVHEQGEGSSFLEMNQLETDSSFGELASLTGHRSTRIVALKDCIFAVLPNSAFVAILKKKKMKKMNETVEFLSDTPYFNEFKINSLYHMHYYFDLKAFLKGQILCTEGSQIKYIYLIKQGEFEMRMTVPRTGEKSENRRSMRIRRGEYLKRRAREGAKGLRRILRNREDEGYKSKSLANSRDEIMEIPVRRLGKGEMFPQDHLSKATHYSATLKCVSMNAQVFLISKENFIRWVYKQPEYKKYQEADNGVQEEGINDFIEQFKKVKIDLKQKKENAGEVGTSYQLDGSETPKQEQFDSNKKDYGYVSPEIIQIKDKINRSIHRVNHSESMANIKPITGILSSRNCRDMQTVSHSLLEPKNLDLDEGNQSNNQLILPSIQQYKDKLRLSSLKDNPSNKQTDANLGKSASHKRINGRLFSKYENNSENEDKSIVLSPLEIMSIKFPSNYMESKELRREPEKQEDYPQIPKNLHKHPYKPNTCRSPTSLKHFLFKCPSSKKRGKEKKEKQSLAERTMNNLNTNCLKSSYCRENLGDVIKKVKLGDIIAKYYKYTDFTLKTTPPITKHINIKSDAGQNSKKIIMGGGFPHYSPKSLNKIIVQSLRIVNMFY